MNEGNPEKPDITGAAMDRIVVRRKSHAIWFVVGAGVVLAVIVGTSLRDQALRVRIPDLTISTVESVLFREELPARASVESIDTVLLDVVDGGRVEKVYTVDGVMVSEGTPLFRLANPTLQQQMLERESEVAQQTTNLGTLKASLQVTKTEHRRRIAELNYELHRIDRELERFTKLSSDGFISSAALEEMKQRRDLQRLLFDDARAAMEAEVQIKQQAVKQLEGMMARLHAGLALIGESVRSLEVKAPRYGKLTGFNLKEGAILKPGESVGRIDVPGAHKLVATIDEYYLSKLTVGASAIASVDGREFAAVVERLNPQVRDGRFVAELTFVGARPDSLSAGQSIELRIVLAAPRIALTILDGDFYKDTGGAWVYVLANDSKRAERRPVRLGKRSSGRIQVLEGLNPGDQVIVSTYLDYGSAQKLDIQR